MTDEELVLQAGINAINRMIEEAEAAKLKPYEQMLEQVLGQMIKLLIPPDRLGTTDMVSYSCHKAQEENRAMEKLHKIVGQCMQNVLGNRIRNSNGFTQHIKGTPEEILAKFGNVLTEEQKQEISKHIKQP